MTVAHDKEPVNRVQEFCRKHDYPCWCGKREARLVCKQLFGNHPFAVMQCAACRTHRLLPRALPSQEAAEALYGQQEFFHTEAELEKIKEHNLRRFQELDVLFGPDKSVLEVGCGDGRTLNAICDRYGCMGRGIDLDPRRIATAKLHAKRAEFECGLFETHRLDRRFDVVVAIAVLEHVLDPVLFLKQLGAAMAPGGSLFVLTPNTGSLSYRVLGSWWRELLGIGQHIYLFGPENLETCARRAGLKVVRHLTDFDFGPPQLQSGSVRGVLISLWWCYRESVRRLAQLLRTPTSGDLLCVHLKAI